MPAGSSSLDALWRQLSTRIDRLDVRLLIQHVLGVSHAALIANPAMPVSSAQVETLEVLTARRAAGEPLAYLVGTAEFYGLSLAVTNAVLVPRPDTETLVDIALARMRELSDAADPRARPLTVLDLGTGSGAIPLAIKRHFPAARVIGVDISADALAVARNNAKRLDLAIEFIESDWYSSLPADLTVDVLVSNPPYIAAGDPHLSGDGVRYEPTLALSDGSDGLSCIEKIITGARAHLRAGGWLLLEHGYDQAVIVREMLRRVCRQSGVLAFDEVQSWPDLGGVERVSGGRVCSAV